jgi:ubiquinone/menaquinone biosynthesis C-methylase UbiE
MNQMISNLGFRVMAWMLKRRDRPEFFGPILAEAGISRGMTVLDFGCGPGSFSVAAAQIVGPIGNVYALDVHPLAILGVRARIEKSGLDNMTAILSDCDTGLADESINVALLYDVFHMLKEKERVLAEICRILKADGILSFSDHHLGEEMIVVPVTAGGKFKLVRRGARTYSFVKINPLLQNGGGSGGKEGS